VVKDGMPMTNGYFGIAANLPIVLHGMLETKDLPFDVVCYLSQSQSPLPVFAGKEGVFTVICQPEQP